jgi:hypothetical protein
MNEQYITVEIRQVYGRETIYPHDNPAQLFAQMLGQTTLTRDNIRYIKALGFAVRVHYSPVTL